MQCCMLHTLFRPGSGLQVKIHSTLPSIHTEQSEIEGLNQHHHEPVKRVLPDLRPGFARSSGECCRSWLYVPKNSRANENIFRPSCQYIDSLLQNSCWVWELMWQDLKEKYSITILNSMSPSWKFMSYPTYTTLIAIVCLSYVLAEIYSWTSL